MKTGKILGKLTALVLAVVLMLSVYSLAYALESTPQTFSMDVPSFTENGRTFVPVRFVAEAFGIYVTWRGSSRTVTLSRGNIVVSMQIGSKTLSRLNDGSKSEIIMDVAPVIKEGRTFLPVRYWAEAFGLEVTWDGQTKTVSVVEGGKTLSFVVSSSKLTMRGGRFLKPYEQSADYLFFYPEGGIVESGLDGRVKIKGEIDGYSYEIGVAKDSLDSFLGPLFQPIETLEQLKSLLEKENSQNNNIQMELSIITVAGRKALFVRQPAQTLTNVTDLFPYNAYTMPATVGIAFIEEGYLFTTDISVTGPDDAVSLLLAESISNDINLSLAYGPRDVMVALTQYTANSLKFLDCDGNVLLTAADFKEAKVGGNAQNGSFGYYAELILVDPAKFTKISKAVAGKPEGKNIISISIDGVTVTSPYVSREYAETGITSDSVVITMRDYDECKQLVDTINACIQAAQR